MRHKLLVLCMLFALSILCSKNKLCQAESVPPPIRQEHGEVSNFVGGPDARFNAPFTVRYLVFSMGVEIPPELRQFSAQWLYPPETACEGAIFLNESGTLNPLQDAMDQKPHWKMVCRSGWMAFGTLRATDEAGEYFAEGNGPLGKSVSFNFRKLSPAELNKNKESSSKSSTAKKKK